jgi:hypothetical protein
MTNVVHPEFDRLRRIGAEIKGVLDEMHREGQRLGQDGWPLDWRNGHSPYDYELDALKEKHGVDYAIVWNADGRTVKSVRVRSTAATAAQQGEWK